MSGSAQCPHADLHFHLNNARFGDTNIHYLEIKASCVTCGADMVFRGLPVGMSPEHPTASLDGKEIVLPFLGNGEDLTGRPIGYSIEMRR